MILHIVGGKTETIAMCHREMAGGSVKRGGGGWGVRRGAKIEWTSDEMLRQVCESYLGTMTGRP